MANNTNISLTIEAWADITIRNWLDKIDKLNINRSFQLYNSFVHHVVSNAGGDIARIEFAFDYYGKFVEMGVGKGVSLEDVGIDTKRRPKRWYSKTLYAELIKLSELLAEKYAHKGALAIVESVQGKKLV